VIAGGLYSVVETFAKHRASIHCFHWIEISRRIAMQIGRAGRLAVLCGLVVTLMPVVKAMAAIDAYMTIEGAKQGKIKGGDVKTAGTEQIRLTDVVRNDAPGGSAASGMATGRRQHGTITIVKEIDKASPMLYQAMSSNEVFQVSIVYPAGSAKTEKAAQKIDLSDAMITSIQNTGTAETIKLTYRQIEVTYVNGNKSAQDAWDAK
jgi:type VI secretion system secreted protein Hcp